MPRPLAFGVRLRHKDRTLRLQNDPRDPRRYVVEDSRKSRGKRERGHASLGSALSDLAATWRERLH